MLTTIASFSLFLLKFCHAVGFFLRVFLTKVYVHAVDILKTETGGKDCHLNLFAQFRVSPDTPLYLEIARETCHEVVDIIHLLHHQTGVIVLFIAEIDAKKYLP